MGSFLQDEVWLRFISIYKKIRYFNFTFGKSYRCFTQRKADMDLNCSITICSIIFYFQGFSELDMVVIDLVDDVCRSSDEEEKISSSSTRRRLLGQLIKPLTVIFLYIFMSWWYWMYTVYKMWFCYWFSLIFWSVNFQFCDII